jgi:glutathione S-transferase
MTLEYVDLTTARAARGTRIVTSALVASPWSEATKGMFTLASLPAMVVSRGRDATDITAWTGVDNVPAVLHEDEPVRTNWAAIVGLAARLAGRGVLVPTDPEERADVMGLLELIAGETGLGWNARLAMIQVSHESDGQRGFSMPVAMYLAKRYGFDRTALPSELRERVARQLRVVEQRLEARASSYFGGDHPNAVDVYAAAFLTPLAVIDETTCPQMIAPLRAAFGTAHELLGDLVPPLLWAHRTMMFERHLTLPIRLA